MIKLAASLGSDFVASRSLAFCKTRRGSATHTAGIRRGGSALTTMHEFPEVTGTHTGTVLAGDGWWDSEAELTRKRCQGRGNSASGEGFLALVSTVL